MTTEQRIARAIEIEKKFVPAGRSNLQALTTLQALRNLAANNATVSIRRGGRQAEIKTGSIVASEGREFFAAGQRFDANDVSFIDLADMLIVLK